MSLPIDDASARHLEAFLEMLAAERNAAAMRHEAEDYVARKLAAFEVVLDRTMQPVQKGRERLQVHAPTPVVSEADADDGGFFDQDEL